MTYLHLLPVGCPYSSDVWQSFKQTEIVSIQTNTLRTLSVLSLSLTLSVSLCLYICTPLYLYPSVSLPLLSTPLSIFLYLSVFKSPHFLSLSLSLSLCIPLFPPHSLPLCLSLGLTPQLSIYACVSLCVTRSLTTIHRKSKERRCI